MKKYSHIPDLIHRVIFAKGIEALAPGVKNVRTYTPIKFISLWFIRISAVAIAVGLSLFLVWLWLAKIVIMGGAPGNDHDGDDGVLDADEEYRNIMFEETGVGIKNVKL